MLQVRKLAEACQRVYEVNKLVDVMGFADHPVIQSLRASGKLSSHRGLVLDVLHHADIDTLFSDLPDLPTCKPACALHPPSLFQDLLSS